MSLFMWGGPQRLNNLSEQIQRGPCREREDNVIPIPLLNYTHIHKTFKDLQYDSTPDVFEANGKDHLYPIKVNIILIIYQEKHSAVRQCHSVPRRDRNVRGQWGLMSMIKKWILQCLASCFSVNALCVDLYLWTFPLLTRLRARVHALML